MSVCWKVHGKHFKAFLLGIIYYDNPSGEKNSTSAQVPFYHGIPGEMAFFEEHRYPMPFAFFESGESKLGATIHSIPSPLYDTKNPDHWWSLGVAAYKGYSELPLFSDPVAYNNQKSIAKALQSKPLRYGNAFISIPPGAVIAKTFYLDINNISNEGSGFQKPVYKAVEMFKPFYYEDLPSYKNILGTKYNFAKSRWIEDSGFCGFNMYPKGKASKIVMGWCGQAESCGYSFQVLKDYFNDPRLDGMVQQSLDFLTTSPVKGDGFPVIYDTSTSIWSQPDHVSMGQVMFNFTKAIQASRKNGNYKTSKWESFFKKACEFASDRILDENWYPISTAEGFYIALLAIASKLFTSDKYKAACIKAANHYAKRHLKMQEPYWGGTLDTSCEDKEGAWAAFQGFLSVYELTKNRTYLDWTKHACDVCLSCTEIWYISLPPGRMTDHFLKPEDGPQYQFKTTTLMCLEFFCP